VLQLLSPQAKVHPSRAQSLIAPIIVEQRVEPTVPERTGTITLISWHAEATSAGLLRLKRTGRQRAPYSRPTIALQRQLQRQQAPAGQR
jgi:hypothetical protein